MKVTVMVFGRVANPDEGRQLIIDSRDNAETLTKEELGPEWVMLDKHPHFSIQKIQIKGRTCESRVLSDVIASIDALSAEELLEVACHLRVQGRDASELVEAIKREVEKMDEMALSTLDLILIDKELDAMVRDH
jgi:hypothetical protein